MIASRAKQAIQAWLSMWVPQEANQLIVLQLTLSIPLELPLVISHRVSTKTPHNK
jgi:hypothetical protein